MMPLEKINDWLDQEHALGSQKPNCMVLATATKEAVPHSRIVVIREVTENGILFFTQRNTRKVDEILENASASMTLWLPLQQREVVLEGMMETLSQDENKKWWKIMPYERQLRLSAYSSSSGKVNTTIIALEKRLEQVKKIYRGHEIPMSKLYCGFRLNTNSICFYTSRKHAFSEVIQYTIHNGIWRRQCLSF